MGGGQMGSMPQSAMHGGPMGSQMNIIAANQMNNVANAGGPIVNTNSISNQMAMGGQMGNTMSGTGPMSNQMGGVMNNSMIGGQIAPPMSAGMAHSQINHMAAAGQRKVSIYWYFLSCTLVNSTAIMFFLVDFHTYNFALSLLYCFYALLDGKFMQLFC